MVPIVPSTRYEPTMLEIVVSHATTIISIVAFAVFMYFIHKLLTAIAMNRWLRITGYIYFTLLTALLIFATQGIMKAIFIFM